jgi:hypothetical protein
MQIGMPFWSFTSRAISVDRLPIASASRRSASALVARASGATNPTGGRRAPRVAPQPSRRRPKSAPGTEPIEGLYWRRPPLVAARRRDFPTPIDEEPPNICHPIGHGLHPFCWTRKLLDEKGRSPGAVRGYTAIAVIGPGRRGQEESVDALGVYDGEWKEHAVAVDEFHDGGEPLVDATHLFPRLGRDFLKCLSWQII